MKVVKKGNEYNIATPKRNIPLGGTTFKGGEPTNIKLVLYRDLTATGRQFLSERSRRNFTPLTVVGVVNEDAPTPLR